MQRYLFIALILLACLCASYLVLDGGKSATRVLPAFLEIDDLTQNTNNSQPQITSNEVNLKQGSQDDSEGLTKANERQRRFGAEREIMNKESVPDKVWRQIVQGEDNESIRQQIEADDRPEAWVEASLIDISKNDVPALLVVGRKAPLANFNKASIWIFTRDGNDYKRALSVRVFELEILDEEVNGYRSIKIFNVTARNVFEEVFRFDGHRYSRS